MRKQLTHYVQQLSSASHRAEREVVWREEGAPRERFPGGQQREQEKDREKCVGGEMPMWPADSTMAKSWARCADSEGLKAQQRRGGGAEELVMVERVVEGEMESLLDLFVVSGYSISLRWCVCWMCVGVCRMCLGGWLVGL